MNNIQSLLVDLWRHPHSDIPKIYRSLKWSDGSTTNHGIDKDRMQSFKNNANFSTGGYAIVHTASNL